MNYLASYLEKNKTPDTEDRLNRLNPEIQPEKDNTLPSEPRLNRLNPSGEDQSTPAPDELPPAFYPGELFNPVLCIAECERLDRSTGEPVYDAAQRAYRLRVAHRVASARDGPTCDS